MIELFCKSFFNKNSKFLAKNAKFKGRCLHKNESFKCESSWTRFSSNSNNSVFRNYTAYFAGFSMGIVGIVLKCQYRPEESYQNNLKAMVVTMMMTDDLDSQEKELVMNSLESVYNEDSTKKREDWCTTEIKSFMNCSEKYGDFQDNRCKRYRMLLKSCLQAKKNAPDIVKKYPVEDSSSVECPCCVEQAEQGIDPENKDPQESKESPKLAKDEPQEKCSDEKENTEIEAVEEPLCFCYS